MASPIASFTIFVSSRLWCVLDVENQMVHHLTEQEQNQLIEWLKICTQSLSEIKKQ
ncbi:hypothetical protein [Melghirimyces algeriensis]|uniref:hypothetical protein n=1 Tax=Melghirimyces algeriensis TaxID=910412 RepID=UPI00163DE2C5|nr:hypothetical protein [Melghirimyces algeriensis]